MEQLLFRTVPGTPDWVAWGAALVRGFLIIFFVYMGTKNLVGDEKMLADFSRWGYPDWFRVLTAVLQILGAVMLIAPIISFYGTLLLSCILLGAIATHLMHDPLPTALSPLLFVMFTIALGVYYRPELLR